MTHPRQTAEQACSPRRPPPPGLWLSPTDPGPPPSRRCTRFPFPAWRAGGATVHHGAMNEIFQVRRANADDLPVILGMIDEAAAWLRTKDTDQWDKPWPTEAARNARVLRGLCGGYTWIAEERGTPVATITYRQHGNRTLWTKRERLDPAVYISRLIVTRDAAGRGIGSAMIDWAAQRAVSEWGAKWIRIDVWTTNLALHNYYEKRGFRFWRKCPLDQETYPSAALFQKSAGEIDEAATAQFAEASITWPDLARTPPAPPQPTAAAPVGAAG
jgi:GNAT superfamily N-acetyltransferase